MRKVLLVDDDPKSRMGIKAILLRSDTEFKDVFECSDGIEAENTLQKMKFDLVITDMKMPNMDGISFIRWAQSLAHKPKFLILSGYQNFSFAAEALKYGVKDYLLKPVGRRDLIESVSKIERELQEEEELDFERNKTSTMLSLLRTKEVNFIFLNDMLTEKEIYSILDNVMLDIFYTEFYIYALEPRFEKNRSLPLLTAEGGLKELVYKYFRDSGDNVLSFLDMSSRIIVISNSKIDIAELLKYVSNNEAKEYVSGEGNRGVSPAEIRKVYLQALEALKYKVFDKDINVLRYCDVDKLSKEYHIPVNSIKKIPEMIGTSMYKEIGSLISDLFDTSTLCMYNIGYSEKMVEYLYNYIYQYFMEHLPAEFTALEQESRDLKSIFNYSLIKEYLDALRIYLDELNGLLTKSQDNLEEKNKIDDALKYIHDNYSKDISLTTASNHVSLNYNYFSNMFHQKTGVRFIEYLINIRVSKAKELLNDKDCSIMEVARKVGYSNPKHFTKIFRSATGISPLQYRKKLSIYDTAGNS